MKRKSQHNHHRKHDPNGPQHDQQLDAMFEQADFAIGSLGRHRSGITHIKTLKTSEYAARGLAFTYSEID